MIQPSHAKPAALFFETGTTCFLEHHQGGFLSIDMVLLAYFNPNSVGAGIISTQTLVCQPGGIVGKEEESGRTLHEVRLVGLKA